VGQALSVIKLANRLQSEADAWLLLEEWRWGDTGTSCAHCGCTDVHYIEPSNGTTRATRTGSMSARRVWKCHKRGGGCGKQFTATVGTIFHGTKIPLRTWMFVLFEMVASKNGVAAREIERKYDLTAKSAWFMLQRIREAMKRDALMVPMSGTVVADETFIGGKAKNKHRPRGRKPIGAGAQSGPVYEKTAVLSLIDTETGEVRSRVVPDVTGATLSKAMGSLNVDKSNTTLHTDAWVGYRAIEGEFQGHEYVDHTADEYVRDGVSTNRAEGYFSQLKRSLDGTHHHVSTVHLDRYLAEFDFRYSTRMLSDEARLARLMGQTPGRRLTYRPTTGGAA
jgi:hypothetical protein